MRGQPTGHERDRCRDGCIAERVEDGVPRCNEQRGRVVPERAVEAEADTAWSVQRAPDERHEWSADEERRSAEGRSESEPLMSAGPPRARLPPRERPDETRPRLEPRRDGD